MKVTPNGPDKTPGTDGTGASAASRLRRASTPSTPAGAAAQSTDGTPELSSRAQDFLRLRTQLDAIAPASREDRIQALRAQIDNGTYVIDGARIADAMLQDTAAARALGLGSK